MVRPILEYATVIWYPLNKTQAKEIEKVQERATKLIPSLRKIESYEERLKTLKLTTLAYRRDRADMLQVFRIMKGIDNIDPEQFFTLSEKPHHDTRGHELTIDKPRATSKIRLNSFSQRVINPWNKLPDKAIKCNELIPFKKALEEAWVKNPIKYEYPLKDENVFE